jgi:hypothetical protein
VTAVYYAFFSFFFKEQAEDKAVKEQTKKFTAGNRW